MLQAGYPLRDDPAGRAALRERLAIEVRRCPRLRRPPILLPALPALLLLAIAAWGPTTSQARLGLAHFIRFTTQPLRQGLPAQQAGILPTDRADATAPRPGARRTDGVANGAP